MNNYANSELPVRNGAAVPDEPAKPSPHFRPRLPDEVRSYTSKLDQYNVSLRTTSDGNLVNEDTGDWLNKTAAKGPSIGLPESKNGATGLDPPRARKPLGRLLRNKWHHFDRLPPENEHPQTLGQERLQRDVSALLQQANPAVDIGVLSEIQMHHGQRIGKKFGGDWFEHALNDRDFWQHVLVEALETHKGQLGAEM
ncbi:hypothetical protein FB567DRAFT_590407 [Paraphoma chrysanthemicola]|uniref:Uncharacterized protein n=1 Tax=Paraphoma chrysanthemicola TaxID=798071 RepID=A0A8K0R9D2_9PLEO|nr:hypothetical protein FB567DRAFT_590407 [Paraphoma chrysanthemicola]